MNKLFVKQFIVLISFLIFPLLCFSETFTHTFAPGYNLFSFPFEPTNKSISALGLQNPQIWSYDTQNKKWLSHDDNFQLERGKGYLLWVDKETTISLDGTTTVLLCDFFITLKKGWNLLGNPFSKDVYMLNNLLIDGQTLSQTSLARDKKLYKFSKLTNFAELNSSYAMLGESAGIEPWTAYWIYAEYDGQMVFKDNACTINIECDDNNNNTSNNIDESDKKAAHDAFQSKLQSCISQYGLSYNTSKLTVNDIKILSSDQMLCEAYFAADFLSKYGRQILVYAANKNSKQGGTSFCFASNLFSTAEIDTAYIIAISNEEVTAFVGQSANACFDPNAGYSNKPDIRIGVTSAGILHSFNTIDVWQIAFHELLHMVKYSTNTSIDSYGINDEAVNEFIARLLTSEIFPGRNLAKVIKNRVLERTSKYQAYELYFQQVYYLSHLIGRDTVINAYFKSGVDSISSIVDSYLGYNFYDTLQKINDMPKNQDSNYEFGLNLIKKGLETSGTDVCDLAQNDIIHFTYIATYSNPYLCNKYYKNYYLEKANTSEISNLLLAINTISPVDFNSNLANYQLIYNTLVKEARNLKMGCDRCEAFGTEGYRKDRNENTGAYPTYNTGLTINVYVSDDVNNVFPPRIKDGKIRIKNASDSIVVQIKNYKPEIK